MNTIYSVIGGLMGTVVLIVFSFPVARFALKFRSSGDVCNGPVRPVHDDRRLRRQHPQRVCWPARWA